MLLKNTDKREHAVFNCGFTYTVLRNQTADIPDGIAHKMMRRFPKLVIVNALDSKKTETEAVELEGEFEMAENNVEPEGSEADDDEIDEILA